jgi:pimeloyl-ACP methyl ester carboxylesterase
MASFVLVHGSWHGGWCWQRLAPILRAAGHEVHAPTLSGMGERAHAPPADLRLATHVDDVARLLAFEDLRDVVLVGHSYAGMVITGAAAREPARLRALVYLDAYLPDAGESEADLWPPEMGTEVRADIAAGRTHRRMPPMAFFGLEGRDAAWAEARLTPQPLSVYLDPASRAPLPSVPARFIHCTQGPLSEVFAAFAARARARGWPVDELATGHDAMLTMPDELAKLLLRAA